jgi:phospholipase C
MIDSLDSRRDFLKKAALLAAGGSLASIQRVLAIDPAKGSTYLDAEQVVILMQENRSFDHCYGALRGVRGFNDPRAVKLPNGNPVWLQTTNEGETYAPFRLNIKDTKATWMSSLPHSWVDQVDARNGGKHDGWLEAKRSGRKEYGHMPLTLGFYNREDIPFYYALADAFTVCDQNFCSSLTGTTPNRLYLWTGTIREEPSILSKANIRNSDVDYGSEASWKTFPERLAEAGVPWRIYQNEISLSSGLAGEQEAWLANFTDNPIEWFSQFNVRFSPSFRRHLAIQEKSLAAELPRLEAEPKPWSDDLTKKIRSKRAQLEQVRQEIAKWTEANFNKLSQREQNLHRKAFTTNAGDPQYRELTTLNYKADGAPERQMQVPKGDILHQFREDVRTGKLPTVSWIVAPENFSDHPGAPWYGAWYLSETLDILAQNPEVWKKTIFILCYDENDGYFDHVPPFVPPHPDRPETGKASAGIDTSVEHVRIEQEEGSGGRAGPIGLGYRVPLLIASPWSRGGYVCSQVFDHTSILQFLEKWLGHKTGRPIREENISTWRRTVCGDLTSVFRPYNGEKIDRPEPVERESFLSSIHQAKFKQIPNGFKKLQDEEIAEARKDPRSLQWLPQQENGVRPSCALPYELAVDGSLSADRKSFVIRFESRRELFGDRAAGAPFHVYSPAKMRSVGGSGEQFESGRTWAYAVSAGDQITDSWKLADFADAGYHLCVHGPNGFFREFRGTNADPLYDFKLEHGRNGKTPTTDLLLHLVNRDSERRLEVVIEDFAYGEPIREISLAPSGTKEASATIVVKLEQTFGWYDLGIRVKEMRSFERRYAGRLETGNEGFSDPSMGRVI